MRNSLIFSETVRTFQIDSNRHVSNIVYIQWMEIGRLKLLEALGIPAHKTEEQGFMPVLAETHIKYRRPILLSDSVEIELWLSELAGVYAWMEFEFRTDADALVAVGRQKGVFLDIQSGKPKKLNEDERAIFLPYFNSRTSF